MALSTLTITIHRAYDLPDKAGMLHRTTTPHIVVYMMKEKYVTETVTMANNEAIWEETWTTPWDGVSHLAIDLHSRDSCIGKLWLDLNEMLDGSGRWCGTLAMDSKSNKAEPKLAFTVLNMEGHSEHKHEDQTAAPPATLAPSHPPEPTGAPLPTSTEPPFPAVAPPTPPSGPPPFPGDHNYPPYHHGAPGYHPYPPHPGYGSGYGSGYYPPPHPAYSGYPYPPPPYPPYQQGPPYEQGPPYQQAPRQHDAEDCENLTAF